MEKLLRSTKAKKVLVLIRPKKGLETRVRLVELLSAKIFDNLRENSPAALSRVEAISGDITQQHFGLSRDDERLVGWSDCVDNTYHVVRLYGWEVGTKKLMISVGTQKMKTFSKMKMTSNIETTSKMTKKL